MTKQSIQSAAAPAAVGPYSHAIAAGKTVYLSGQLGLDPANGALCEGFEAQANRVFLNLQAVAQAAGGDLSDIVKLTVFVLDLADFAKLNNIMADYFGAPYPARSAIQAAALPKGGLVEVEAVMVIA